MKIIAIGRNYAAHIAELKNEQASEPVVFLKPDTAVLRNNEPFFYPDFSKDIHYEVEVLVKICKEGKFIDKKFAHKYYNEIGLGIDFTARDIQQICKDKGLPWEKAKAFNGSAPISDFVDKSQFEDVQNIHFHLDIDGQTRQTGNTSLMLHPIDEIIAYVSTFFTLKKGDIIFTGTPEGVGSIAIGNILTGYLENQKMFAFEIK